MHTQADPTCERNCALAGILRFRSRAEAEPPRSPRARLVVARGYRTMKGSTAPVVTTVVPNVTVTETPLAPFIAAVVFTLSWNCFEIGS